MSDLLFEIGTEELPAGFIDPALAWMKETIQTELNSVRLEHGEIEVAGTPRRLVVMVHKVAPKQADLKTEVLGPKVEIAFDGAGALSKAGAGFLKSRGLQEDAVYKKETDKGTVIAAWLEQKGLPAAEVLPEILTTLLRKMPFAKTMRWESSNTPFARPIRWMVCLLGKKVLPLTYAGVIAGGETCGHRFLSPDFCKVDGLASYLDFLQDNWVMLKGEERRQTILEKSEALAKEKGGKLCVDEALLDTLKNLVEYPWPVLGSFESSYLKIPREILICEMREHQKYFAVEDANQKLMPFFIVVAGTKPKDESDLALGNARVLRARFEDGSFYFTEDKKKTLEQYTPKLSGLLFQKELGSVLEKTERIEGLVRYLSRELKVSAAVQESALRVAKLCKADLVTGVVGQFPELQGVMGRIYAQLSGESEDVAKGIEEHYWPRFSTDSLSTHMPAWLVGVADRVDTLVGVIGVGKMPKGNADVFALRRASIALIRMIQTTGYRLSLKALVQKSTELLLPKLILKPDILESEVLSFIHARARGVFAEDLSEQGALYPTILVDAAMGVSADDITDVWARIQALYALQQKNPEVFLQLAATFKRASNLVSKAKADGVFGKETPWKKEVLVHASEKALLEQIEKLKPNAQDYVGFLAQVALLKPCLDRFFDDVMVMVNDTDLRHARLGLLSRLELLVNAVADFGRIQIG